MLPIPQLQIRQTPAVFMIDADPGQLSISQPKAELQQHTQPAQLSIEQYKPELRVDQSRAFAAYHGGKPKEMNDRLIAGFQQNFLQALAARAQLGERMAAINEKGSNPIADIYAADTEGNPLPEFRGKASMDNVDVTFNVRPPQIHFTPAEVDIQVQVNRPEIGYTRGKLDMYVQQYNKVEYIPPALDTML
ncbi:DUF6470 family protein [Saccharibacillus qingshengii]|uniref:DUF6470 family protein n=1 Tax=Saccharibacillus qingshengii TaxID=1763540 RepID=UPI001551B8C1|nr:DUF6470 family protein [Saccharibacillus qingshengii]